METAEEEKGTGVIKSRQYERPKTILIVDDQEIIRDALGAMLEDQYEILYAENGREAMDMIQEHMEELSIVLLDLIMPVMNGFQVLEHIREDEELRKIPVIVMTAEREAELKALQAGAADFITKPFDEVEVVLARVGRIIELSEGRKLISAAEHDKLTGLISMVDSFVWKETAVQVRKWQEKYGFTLPVSVNLSRSDVFDAKLVDRLANLIGNNALEYGDIKLEVTESAYTDDAKTVLEMIRRLRETGFEIEMDDFGSGYSSLNMISDMPVDVLKMDMKFIRNIVTSETDRRLVSLILDIARYLRVKVVAEGVETEEQLKILRESGCTLVQGYYFSRPLPPEEFEKLIERYLAAERKG